MRKPRALPFRSEALNRRVLDALKSINETKMGAALPWGGLCCCLNWDLEPQGLGYEVRSDAVSWFLRWIRFYNEPFLYYLPDRGFMTRARKMTLNKVIKQMRKELG